MSMKYFIQHSGIPAMAKNSIKDSHIPVGDKIPSLSHQRMLNKIERDKKQANRIVGKKKFFLLMIPLIIVILAFVLSTLSAALWGKENLGMSYYYLFATFITVAASGVMYSFSYLFALLVNQHLISHTHIGFNKGLWLVPIITGVFSFIPNIYPIALPHQRTLSNYLMIAAIGFLITLVWIIILKGYLKYKKKQF